MESETTSSKTVDEPMYISARRAGMTVTSAIATMGIDVRDSICVDVRRRQNQ